MLTTKLFLSAAVVAISAVNLPAQALRLQDHEPNVTIRYDHQAGEFTPANKRYIATQTADDVRSYSEAPAYGWQPSGADVGRKHPATHAPVARARAQAIGPELAPVPVKHYAPWAVVEDCVHVAFPQCSGGN